MARRFKPLSDERVSTIDDADRLLRQHTEALKEQQGALRSVEQSVPNSIPRVLATGRIAPAGEFSSQHGCESVTRTATGVFEIVTTEKWSADEIAVVATGRDSGGGERRVTVGAITPGSRAIEFTARDGSGTANNAEVNFAVFLVR